MLHEEISCFLKEEGLDCTTAVHGSLQILSCNTAKGTHMTVLPVRTDALNADDSVAQASCLSEAVMQMQQNGEGFPLIITEDRWRAQNEMMKARLLAHLEIFDQIYARNCEVRRIDKRTAADFLMACHSYGDAACRYRYGLFLKRHTGHIAADGDEAFRYAPGTLVAVATFSNARKWTKGEKVIRSYEWTRYASLPGVRLSGGMGKLLKTFIGDVKPDDIMTYADLEWSEGKVYETLGFQLEGRKDPVTFIIDKVTWRRQAICSQDIPMQGSVYFQNFGSNKYRLKLTDYQ